MALTLKTDYLKDFIKEHEYSLIKGEVKCAYEKLLEKGEPSEKPTGWLTLPEDYDKDEFERILSAS